MATNKDYLHPNWQKKRLEIMKRDNFKCRICEDDKNTLHVHHHYYIKGRKVWDYLNSALTTRCEKCHKELHEEKIDTTVERVNNLFRMAESMREGKQDSYMGNYYRAILNCMSDKEQRIPRYITGLNSPVEIPFIPTIDIIEGALYYNIKWKNIKKYINYCAMFGQIISPKEILEHNRDITKFYGRGK